jgi:hypothetical protein
MGYTFGLEIIKNCGYVYTIEREKMNKHPLLFNIFLPPLASNHLIPSI